jgi:hypothetical protein
MMHFAKVAEHNFSTAIYRVTNVVKSGSVRSTILKI